MPEALSFVQSIALIAPVVFIKSKELFPSQTVPQRPCADFTRDGLLSETDVQSFLPRSIFRAFRTIFGNTQRYIPNERDVIINRGNTFLGSRIKLPSRYHNPYATLMASFAHPCINCIYFLLSQLLENQLNGFWKINFISRQENMYKLLRKFSSGKYS